jgi:transposase
MAVRERVHVLLTEGMTQPNIVSTLQSEGLSCDIRSLRRWIKAWRTDASFLQAQKSEEGGLSSDPEINTIITLAFEAKDSTDFTIIRALFEHDIEATIGQVRRRRWKLGLRYRDRKLADQSARYQETVRRVRYAIEEGSSRSSGKVMLTADLRDEGFPARYSHVELALYQIFHEAGIERPFRPKHYKKRGYLPRRGLYVVR